MTTTPVHRDFIATTTWCPLLGNTKNIYKKYKNYSKCIELAYLYLLKKDWEQSTQTEFTIDAPSADNKSQDSEKS